MDFWCSPDSVRLKLLLWTMGNLVKIVILLHTAKQPRFPPPPCSDRIAATAGRQTDQLVEEKKLPQIQIGYRLEYVSKYKMGRSHRVVYHLDFILLRSPFSYPIVFALMQL